MIWKCCASFLASIRPRCWRIVGWLLVLLFATFFVRHVLFTRYYGEMLRGGVFVVNYEPQALSKRFTLLESRVLADRIMDIYRDLKPVLGLNDTRSRSLLALLHLATELDPRLNSTESAEDPVVCSEKYEGSTKGWVRVRCPKNSRLGELITVVLVSSPHTQRLIKDIHEAYPSMGVVLAIAGGDPRVFPAKKNLRVVSIKRRTASQGQAWNEALRAVKTPYALVGRDMRSFPSPDYAADLERAVRVLLDLPQVAVVGGSGRNTTRHWALPCYQIETGNYAMRLRSGYRYSSKECMYCDYVEGPFVARTGSLLAVGGLDSSLADLTVAFLDMFVRLQDRVLTMTCPDLQFEVTDGRRGTLLGAVDLVPFARKWLLDRVHLPGRNGPLKFDCAVTQVSCRASYGRTDMFLMPPCCRDKLNAVLVVVDEFCREWNLSYVLDSGSVLGAVKMSGVIPWDIDGDVVYLKKDHRLFETEGVKFFADRNLTLSWFKGTPSSGHTYFQILSDSFFVEMWGLDSLQPGNLSLKYPLSVVPFGRDGGWVVAPSNPGKYSRNRYGVDMLKHAHSWRHTGGGSSWESYDAGRFLPCLNFQHHACMDKYPADGNLPFDV